MPLLQHLLFLISISLQAAGALVLMISFWKDHKKEVIKALYRNIPFACRDNNDCVKIPAIELKKAYKELLLNRMGFSLIALGYLMSIVGVNADYNVCWSFIAVIILISLLIGLCYISASVIVNRTYKSDMPIQYRELCEIVGRKLPTNATENEIKEIIN